MTGAGVEDIIDASFVNYVHIVPFFVVKIDNKDRKELIVAIRGTLSLKVRVCATYKYVIQECTVHTCVSNFENALTVNNLIQVHIIMES